MQKTIVWFRKDLRLHDHAALSEAAKKGMIIPVFIWSKAEEQEALPGAASLSWLHHSLQSLQRSFQQLGIPLVIRQGYSLKILLELIQETGANGVYFHRRYEPSIVVRDRYITNSLNRLGVEVRAYDSELLYNPYSISNQNGEPYKVFTPFWKRSMNEVIARPLPRPSSLKGIGIPILSLNIEDLDLLPPIRWDLKFNSYWKPGESGAISAWKNFLNTRLHLYKNERDFPALQAVSSLSPHLAWGEISPKAIWYSAEREVSFDNNLREQVEAFQRQLVWREFGYYQLVHFPSIINKPLRPSFLNFPWEGNDVDLLKWQTGYTGYPLVDAGMRELWETGTMHNRVRMVAASFLVKHLLVPWTKGAEWFQDTLVDYDLANNSMGWQWVTGSGLDSAPYFRIFNPVTQSEKFDKNGDYIRKWIPELAKLPTPYIHKPWTAPKELLESAGVKLGKTYPLPIIDHDFARRRALDAYNTVKQQG